MVLARWGLVPFFTKDLKDVKGLSTINARAESITRAPTWREPMKKRWCIIPANAFYEWEKGVNRRSSPTLSNLRTVICWALRASGTLGRISKGTGYSPLPS